MLSALLIQFAVLRPQPSSASRVEGRGRAVAIVALIAALFVVIGVMHVGFALELRSIASEVRDRLPRPSTRPVTHG